MKFVIVAVGKARPPYADDVEHYSKHLATRARVEQIEVKDSRAALKRIPDRAVTVLLDPEGRALDSVAFAELVSDFQRGGQTVCFLIGGADGIDLRDADHRVSFGPMTLPHQLARVVLLEQLFRAHSILAGEPYHR